MVEILPGITVNLFLLIILGFGVGILSGFAGVGGGFFMTPALIVIGFPANFAVGTSLAWIMGNSIVGVSRHHQLGNVDMQLGLVIIISAMGGTEVGVRIIDWVKRIGVADEVVISISITMLLTIGLYTFLESLRTKRQLDAMLVNNHRIHSTEAKGLSLRFQGIHLPPMLRFRSLQAPISLWIILVIGFIVGMLTGIMGVGGGFTMIPALIYIIGLSSFIAVGTALFPIIFSSAYGCLRHTMSGNVVIFATFIMLLASFIGTYLGASVTRYVRGLSVRYILGVALLLSTTGTILQLVSLLLEQPIPLIQTASIAITFCSLGFMIIMVILLYFIAYRYRHDQNIPGWSKSFVINED